MASAGREGHWKDLLGVLGMLVLAVLGALEVLRLGSLEGRRSVPF